VRKNTLSSVSNLPLPSRERVGVRVKPGRITPHPTTPLEGRGVLSYCLIIATILGRLAFAQASAPANSTTPPPRPPEMLKPHEAVHRGNELLEKNDPKAALDEYENAEKSMPEAREIAFDEGLAQHALGNDDQARSSFGKAMADPPDALSDDALYSLGAIDHTEALAPSGDPKQKLSKLESAMEKYQEVLTHRPDHAEARDANRKAATYWRQIKQQLEQQKQQQQSKNDDQNKDEKQDQKHADNQDQNQKPDQKKNQQQQQAQKQDDQSQQQQSDQSQSADQQKKDQQQQSAQAKEDDKKDPKDSQQAQALKSDEKKDDQKQEDQKQSEDQTAMTTREQAERQLREMMQAMQERNKLHREDATPMAPARSKDW